MRKSNWIHLPQFSGWTKNTWSHYLRVLTLLKLAKIGPKTSRPFQKTHPESRFFFWVDVAFLNFHNNIWEGINSKCSDLQNPQPPQVALHFTKDHLWIFKRLPPAHAFCPPRGDFSSPLKIWSLFSTPFEPLTRDAKSNTLAVFFKGLVELSLRIQVCPKKGDYPYISILFGWD